ncbi:MAG: TonB family protein [Gemmatimonadetes bacterium]|nr:TonB family protein [Gemmatimonadota bacterium]
MVTALSGRVHTSSIGKLSFVLAVALHLALFLAIPAGDARRMIMDYSDLLVVDVLLPGDIPVEVPEAPSRAARPALPTPVTAASLSEEPVASDEAEIDRTIADVPVSLVDPSARRTSPVDRPAEPAFTASWERPPVVVSIVRPSYPSLARQAGIEGSVLARVFIDRKGKVTRVEILEAPSDLFHEPVVRALLQSTFEPAYQGEHAVPSHVLVPVDFRLND